MVKVCSRVVIGVSSHQLGGKRANPFTASERIEMIQLTLQDENLIPTFNIEFVEIPNCADDAEWTKQCLEHVGSACTVWTGNPWVKGCFEAVGVSVKDIKPVPGISGTEVRRRMAAGEAWQNLVPKSVSEYLREIEGVSRLRSV